MIKRLLNLLTVTIVALAIAKPAPVHAQDDASQDTPKVTGTISFTDYQYQILADQDNQVILTAFSKAPTITEVTIPKTITDNGTEYTVVAIAGGVFSGTVTGEGESKTVTSYITSVSIPESVTSIGQSVFADCNKLTTVNIPEGVTAIQNGTFSGCSELTSITIPNGVTSIGQSAFANCSKLTTVTIPEGVTEIQNGAFSGCSALTSISIPETVTSIGQSAFASCSALTSVVIPEGVTAIQNGTFSECSSLTSVTIPEGVTSIGTAAFTHCSSLETIELPSTIKTIGYISFNSCSKLTKIVCNAATPPVMYTGEYAVFPKNAELFVPEESVNAYASDEDWKTFFPDPIAYITLTVKISGDVTVTSDGETLSNDDQLKGNNFTLTIVPEKDNVIGSITLNGTDITSELKDNELDLGTLSESGTLEIVINKFVVTGIDAIDGDSSQIAVKANGNTVEIANLKDGETVSVYNVLGSCVYNGSANVITLNPGQMYIIRAGKQTVKIAI